MTETLIESKTVFCQLSLTDGVVIERLTDCVLTELRGVSVLGLPRVLEYSLRYSDEYSSSQLLVGGAALVLVEGGVSS